MKINLFHLFPKRALVWTCRCGGLVLALLAGGGPRLGAAGELTRPWVFWYWMEAAVTEEGIEADLRAMADAGIGGAYLMPIKGVATPPHIDPPVEQLSPLFWERVRHAMAVAEREGLQLAMHACDGFAVAGGPWVMPEQSMQRVVWSRLDIEGGGSDPIRLPQPETRASYYRDIAVFAIPSLTGAGRDSHQLGAIAYSDREEPLTRLLDPENGERYRADESGWIAIHFPGKIHCRSVRVIPEGNNFQAMRLTLMASEDGEHFEEVCRLEPPRHGWQDEGPVTWAVPETPGRVFRLVYDPSGSEPGAEDLDFAKWRPVLKLLHVAISEEPRVSQFEGKSAAVWRIAPETPAAILPEALCVPLRDIWCMEDALSPEGELRPELPPGRWTVLRMGHTSTGKTNYIGGNGRGLEIDKFSAEAARLQFREWFGEAIEQVGPERAEGVLKGFHVDSWECGSQNWSLGFREDFRRLRGYDPLPYLPLMAGIPIESAALSEQFLHDLRWTISELVEERFFGTLVQLAGEAGCWFSAESLAPTMVADALRHFGTVDLPMGEFWFRSPTHDKPTDILDAVSGGRLYGKPIIQAEAFTQLRIAWDEHPGLLKALGDRHFAAGINRLVFHVFAHNPWVDRAPGMTLSGVGLYFQRDQTWWPAVGAWTEYLTRCQEWLQRGRPVVDVAVFTGEDVPSRSLLPEDLARVLPGLFDPADLQRERERLANEGQPQREAPTGVRASANIRDPLEWIDPLNGYQYDSINPDALVRLAEAREGRLVLPGGADYGLLVIPGSRRGAPNAGHFSRETVEKLISLIEAGVPVLFEAMPTVRRSLVGDAADEARREERLVRLKALIEEGRGAGPWMEPTLAAIGLPPDLLVVGAKEPGIAWTHRRDEASDIYFLSNQSDQEQQLSLRFRIHEGEPVVINPVEGSGAKRLPYERAADTRLSLRLEPFGSRIIAFLPAAEAAARPPLITEGEPLTSVDVAGPWRIHFPSIEGGETVLERETLFDWAASSIAEIRHYSGRAVYEARFVWEGAIPAEVYLSLGEVHNLARVEVNDRPVGTCWTHPFTLAVTDALRPGENLIRVEVFNTWANRLIADNAMPEEQRQTFTTAPFRLQGAALLPAGLLGPVRLLFHPPN